METTQLLGRGRYRECFGIRNSDFCIKELKPFSGRLGSAVAHLILDINQYELAIYNSIPHEMRQFFPTECYADESGNVLTRRPRDFDGSFSKTVRQFGQISDTGFWKALDDINSLMLKYNLWFFDVFSSGNNMVVQRIDEATSRPVIIDWKRQGWQSYPFQPELWFESGRVKKLKRRFDRFKLKFQALPIFEN